MTQQPMERLGSADASFLTAETESAPMHIGALMLFDGEKPSADELAAHVRARIHLVPRFRQRLAFAPLGTGSPFWVDDERFDLAHHLRISSLPAPGDESQLADMVGRVFAQRLDRSRPLWEIRLIHGLSGGRFALLSKTHPTMVDGVSAVDIATVLFDHDPSGQGIRAEPWLAQPEPGIVSLIARGAESVASAPGRFARRVVELAANPTASAKQAAEEARGLSEALRTFADPAPEAPLNVEIGPQRRYRWVRAELGDLKHVKDRLGGTVNDVVLAVITGALRRWLHARGHRTDGLELRAQVPVLVRAADEHGRLDNRIAAVRGPLPVGIEDPLERYRTISSAMASLMASKQALGAEVITRLSDFAPPTLLAQSARINGSPRLFNLIVSNVPGPQNGLYLLGRRMRELFPTPFLRPSHALAIAAMSYDGGIGFGLLADPDAIDDLGVVADGIKQALEVLLDAADGSGSG